MTDINIAYYLLQDNLIALIMFAVFGTLAAMIGTLLYLINE
jgi:hypothetical protein